MAEPYVNPAELPVKRRENIALGVLGALLFSAAGGLVHFGLLQLGYIAWISALVGMAAGYFGYGLFSGRKNTVHGAILAVVFTMLMIVAAEYFGLAKEIFDAFKETYDIAFRDALGQCERTLRIWCRWNCSDQCDFRAGEYHRSCERFEAAFDADG